MPPSKTFRLTDLTLSEVSLVDDPANQHAHVMLAKRALSTPRAIVGLTKDNQHGVHCYVFSSDWSAEQVQAWVGSGDAIVANKSGGFCVELQPKSSFTQLRSLAAGTQLRKALLGGMSLDDLRRLLADAICGAYPNEGSDSVNFGPYIRDLYLDSVVFEADGSLWRASYEVTNMGTVLLQPRIEVEQYYRDKTTKTAPAASGHDVAVEDVVARLHRLDVSARVTALSKR